jgi:lipoprotein signal peptidase
MIECEAGGEVWVLPVHTLNLSRTGVAILSPKRIRKGQAVRVVIEQRREGYRRVWRWQGLVVSMGTERGGHRVGIEFAAPKRPHEWIKWLSRNRRAALTRMDPACEDGPAELPEAAKPANHSITATPTAAPRLSSPWFCATIALMGFLTDQLTKLQAFAPAPGADSLRPVLPGLLAGVRLKNYGALGGLGEAVPPLTLVSALVGCLLSGIVARWALRDRLSPFKAFAWGILLAGMLGNLADRLALGYVRDFLQTPLLAGWVFNVADVMVILGAVLLTARWAAGPGNRFLHITSRPLSGKPMPV